MTSRAPLRRAGVVGWPVGHSLSPLIHRIFAGREGIDAAYLALLVEPGRDRLKRALDGLRAAGFAGVNVTLPHKEDALALAAAASGEAEAAGAANMLTFRGDGLYAENSDVAGFRESLAAALGGRAPGPALVLGAGGAARAVILALRAAGAAEIAIANRTPERAAALAARFGLSREAFPVRPEALAGLGVLVNTTSLGMAGAPPLELSLACADPRLIVADIVYRPLKTRLIAAAEARGLAVVDGLDMLMRQAVPGYCAWLGRAAAVDAALRAALVSALEPNPTRLHRVGGSR